MSVFRTSSSKRLLTQLSCSLPLAARLMHCSHSAFSESSQHQSLAGMFPCKGTFGKAEAVSEGFDRCVLLPLTAAISVGLPLHRSEQCVE